MSRFLFLLSIAFLVSVQNAWAQGELAALLDGTERRLERMQDLSADFIHIYEDPLNRMPPEEGHLFLKRPRMMRWEYSVPAEKLFVTDGETVYLYLPDERLVNHYRVNDTFDDRIPIMFLLGRSDLQGEFTRFELLGIPPKVPGARVIRMYPRRETDVQEVLMEVDPGTFDIRRLRLGYRDGSITEFVFNEIETNSGLDQSLFEFVPPPDAEVVEQ